MSQVESNKALAVKFFDAMRAGDSATMLDTIAEDGTIETMGSTPISDVRTKDVLQVAMPQILGAFPKGLDIKVHNVIGEGDHVAVEAESNGTHTSGKHYNNKYHWLFRMRGGKIVMIKEYMDTQLVADVFCGDKAASK